MQTLEQVQIDAMLLAWKQAKETLDAAKETEMALRRQIVDNPALFDPNKENGTQTYNLGEGWKIKATKSINYKVENKNGEAFGVLAQIEKMGDVEKHIARELFRFDANLRVAKYEELKGVNAEAFKLLEDITTTSPGSPTLELIAPKGE